MYEGNELRGSLLEIIHFQDFVEQSADVHRRPSRCIGLGSFPADDSKVVDFTREVEDRRPTTRSVSPEARLISFFSKRVEENQVTYN